MAEKNPQGVHAEDIGSDPYEMTPSGLGEGDEGKVMLPTVAAPPAYTDPSNPAAAGGSVNLPLDTHPLEISEDYGQADFDAGATAGAEGTQVFLDPGNAGVSDKDEEDWTVQDYKDALKSAGLPTSGNKDELADRWAEHLAEGDDNTDNQ